MKQRRLAAKLRSAKEKGKNNIARLRRRGLIPGNLISEGKSTLISFVRKEFELISHAGLASASIIELAIEGAETSRVIVKELQRDPIHGEPIHIDFYQVTAGKPLSVKIKIEPHKTARGIKAGGALEHYIRNLNVRTVPEALRETIVVDISALDVGEAVYYKDLKLPADWKVAIEGNPIVLKIAHPRVAAATETPEAAAETAAAAPANKAP